MGAASPVRRLQLLTKQLNNKITKQQKSLKTANNKKFAKSAFTGTW